MRVFGVGMIQHLYNIITLWYFIVYAVSSTWQLFSNAILSHWTIFSYDDVTCGLWTHTHTHTSSRRAYYHDGKRIRTSVGVCVCVCIRVTCACVCVWIKRMSLIKRRCDVCVCGLVGGAARVRPSAVRRPLRRPSTPFPHHHTPPTG